MRRAVESVLIIMFLTLAGVGNARSEDSSAEAPAEKVERVDLRSAEKDVFSQSGEDGVIQKIFEIIEPGPRFAVEFGAHDGITMSNVRNLVVNQGWSTYQIEGDPERAAQLAEAYRDYPTTTTEQAWVWPGNIEILFEEAGVPKDLDLLVIDIDSNDYYVWRAIHDFEPKVVMIETNRWFAPPQKMVIDYHPMNYWDGTYYVGASLQSMYELAKKKGYELVHQMTKGPNTFWVKKEYFPLFGIEDNSPEAMYKPYPKLSKDKHEKVTWGRNGVPWPKRVSQLTWKNLVIEKKFIFDR